MRKSAWIAKFASVDDELVTFRDFAKVANGMFDGLKTTVSNGTLHMANDRVSLVLKLQDVHFEVNIVDMEDPLEQQTFIVSHVPDAWMEFLTEAQEGMALQGQRDILKDILSGKETGLPTSSAPTVTSSQIRLVASLILNGRVTYVQAARRLRTILAACSVSPTVFQPMESVLVTRIASVNIPDLEEEKIQKAVKSMREYGATETVVDNRPAMVAEIEGFKVTATVRYITYDNNFSIVGWENLRQTGITRDPVDVLRRWTSSRRVRDAMSANGGETVPAPPPSFDEDSFDEAG